MRSAGVGGRRDRQRVCERERHTHTFIYSLLSSLRRNHWALLHGLVVPFHKECIYSLGGVAYWRADRVVCGHFGLESGILEGKGWRRF